MNQLTINFIMIFVIKFSSKALLNFLKITLNLIKNILYLKNEFCIDILNLKKIMCLIN